jgi:DNA-3-methyladenine glycosylase I
MAEAPAPPTDRCPWAAGDELLIAYHDEEWGVQVHDDRHHLELLSLESAQSGLSWLTILRKRDGYREAFFNFVPERVAAMTDLDIERLMGETRIVRNRAKITSTIANARALIDVASQFGSFDDYIWTFVNGAPIKNAFRASGEIPASTPLSAAVAKDLKRRGFRFLGPTTCYAYLQSAGLVNDHLQGCRRWKALPG